MKKFSLLAVLALGGILFAGCKDKEKDKEPAPAADPEATVLVDNTYESFNVFGTNKVVVGDEEVNNDWAVKDFNGMTAISLKQAKDIDEGLYNTLKTKNIKGLYKFEGLVLGTFDSGWGHPEYYMDGDVKKEHNGSYVVKACGCDQNEDEEWIKTCHFPSAESHGESLTPSTLFITSNMSKTEVDGFDHNSNPVAVEAGVYTVVLATYKEAVGDMSIMCGLGIVKTADKEGYVDPVIETYPITSAEVIGTFDEWAGTAMTKDGNSFDKTVALAAGAQLKVRFNGAWTYSLGATALESKVYTENDGNITISEAGNYAVHVELGPNAMTDFLTDKTIVAFTITQVVA